MLYSEELISEVISANDIVDVIGMYTALKKSGRGFVGLCPFHSEKTPSFHVSPDKQLYHCFGCGEGGTVLTFVMKAENLDFVEGLKFLAERARIALPEPETDANADKLFKKKQRLISANAYAGRFFYNCLVSSPEGAAARAYLQERAVLPKTVSSFGLGFAPLRRDALITHLKTLGFSESELVDFGLATVKDNQFIDKFRNRVMFPIIDVRGNVIGFGGRVMDDSKPKYLNSPETAAFNKRLNLFALNFAKNKKNDALILVEGYMDVIALHQVGINNAVATLGTALTEEQARLIGRYAKEAVLCYDTDEAGTKATLRAIEIFAKTDVRVKVLSLTGAKDPDEYIKNHGGGSEAFLQAAKKAVPATLFRINMLKQRFDIDNSLDDKIQFISEAAQVLLSTNNMVEVDTYADMLAKNYDIKKESIYAEIQKLQGKRERQEKRRIVHRTANAGVNRAVVAGARPSGRRAPAVLSPLQKAEKSLLSLMFSSRSVAKYVQGELEAVYFSSEVHKKLAKLIYDAWDGATAPEAAQILLSFDEEQSGYVTQILMDKSVYTDALQAAKDLLLTIRQETITKKISEETDPAVIQKLLQVQAGLKDKRGGSPV